MKKSRKNSHTKKNNQNKNFEENNENKNSSNKENQQNTKQNNSNEIKKEENKFDEKVKKSRKKFIFFTILLVIAITASFLFSSDLEKNFASEDSDFLKSSSLFATALVIGLIDGFNPCAMWVLVYLITLVSELKDKKKMWFIAGTFLIASGIIYFIILTMYLSGWQLLIYLGFTQYVLIVAGIFAVISGAYFLYDFYKSKGQIVCKVGNLQEKQKTMSKIKQIVHSKFTLPTFLALVVLAFSVNLTEFFCSISLPQVFTNVISVADITTTMQFFYIFVYILAFMADDMLIFFLALKAIETPIMDKYSGLAKLIGGIVMLGLGFVLLFFPHLLM